MSNDLADISGLPVLGNQWSVDETRLLLREIGAFLTRWKWLVVARPTHIVVDGILDSFANILDPLATCSADIHHAVPFGRTEKCWPKELKDLVECSAALSLSVTNRILDFSNVSKQTTKRNVGSKKLHEISRFSHLVGSICSVQSLKDIVDIGSGLGYVDRELCQIVENCKILAVESEVARCATADETNQLHRLQGRILQCPKKLEISNIEEVADILSASLGNPCCIIALHACGDLTPLALRLFQESPLAQSALLLSCCYHKMSYSCEYGTPNFYYFPLSGYLKQMFIEGYVDSDLINVSFLRLAAESTREMSANNTEEAITLHAQSVAYRALIQMYLETRAVQFVKKKRKVVKAASRQSWKAYAKAWAANTQVRELGSDWPLDEEIVENDLLSLGSDEDVIGKLVERTKGYYSLRNTVQLLVESFVLIDRLLALMEIGFTNCGLVRVSDPAISPRSIAIFVSR